MTDQPMIPFEPAELQPRHDGWSADKQIAFIEALVQTGCVAAACRRVGMSDSSAYRLRNRPCGAAFRRAWDAALDCSAHRLEQAMFDRALNGVPRPIFFKGEQVGEWRHFDERLAMFLVRHRRPARFGKWIERALAPLVADPDDRDADDEAAALARPLVDIDYDGPDEGNPEDLL